MSPCGLRGRWISIGTKFGDLSSFIGCGNTTRYSRSIWRGNLSSHAPEQLRWREAWEAWIVERYGSVENAEADWGFPAPRDADGNVTTHELEQVDKDGPWRPMIAAYRRFMETLIYEKYSAARRLVKSVDPNHLVSFRMHMAGDPTFHWNGAFLYDFAYLGGAVDLFEPEGYGRVGDWEQVKPGCFTHTYAEWANPALPVIWPEFGVDTLDRALVRPTPKTLQRQAEVVARFYDMLIASGADGVIHWFYPGGFRADMPSDFGITHPDGSDRPVTKVIRRNAQRFLTAPERHSPDTWIEMDRDAHVDGLYGIYKAVQEEYWRDEGKGHTPGLRTGGTGTTSATCPLLAVGNTPCTGTNPPKYLDGFFDVVQVRDANGVWVRSA